MSHGQLKLISINIICIMLKATSLNVHRLHLDLKEVKELVDAAPQEIWIHELFVNLITGLLLIRFLLCFVGLAANIVAIYPILTNSQADLLMPTIIVQISDSLVLNICELAVGYGCLQYLYTKSIAVFVIFLAKIVFKTVCSMLVLKLYWNKYNQLEMFVSFAEHGINPEPDSVNEFEINSQRLAPIGY